MNKLAIAIRTFRRPHYFKQELKSLATNTEVNKADFHIFQSAPRNVFSGIKRAKQEDIEANIKLAKNFDLPNKHVYVMPFNLGNALGEENILSALLPEYEYITLIDDDLVFNKYYIKTLLTLYEQFKDDPQAGMVQASFRHHPGAEYQSEKEARQMEDKVAYGFSHRCEQGYWQHTLKKLLPCYHKYCEMMVGCDYASMLHGEAHQEERKEIEEEFGNMTEDYVWEKCAKRAGFKGIHTMTNRYRIIGEEGDFSFTGDRFKKDGLDGVKLYDVGNVDRYEFVN